MKFPALFLILALLGGEALAQLPASATPAPKKNPFEGWGTDLDKRPGGRPAPTSLGGTGTATAAPFNTPAPTAPAAAVAPMAGSPNASGGIVLSSKVDSPLDITAGGHSLEIADISTLLAKYGSAIDDEGPHAGVTIYPGISYLMPFEQAEKVLVASSPGMRSSTPIATGGFPSGLVAVSYDGSWSGGYNRLYLVKDRANQTVTLEFVAEQAFNPLQAPFAALAGDWHVIDFINARVKGQPRMQIRNFVKDMRSQGHYVIVNTLSQAMHQTTTWYVPEPVINLILYSASQRAGR